MASSSGPADEEMSHEEAEARLQAMRQAVQEQMRQINILEMDAAEHRLVLEALKPLDAGRKCFRMVGSVIVERTVADVKPALQKNLEQVSALPPAALCACCAYSSFPPQPAA
jgi:prefoldin subunit 2